MRGQGGTITPIGPAETTPPVVIVGAGLAGLACAVHLHRAGVLSLVLEAADDVGGRVRTDLVDGFRLDRGFQVLLTAYPEARALLDLEALRPRAFLPGALVRRDGRFHPLSDPFRRASQALGTLLSPVGSLSDKLAIARLRLACTRGSLAAQLEGDDGATLEYLRRFGFGPGIIESFFRPFLGGVFLERELVTTSRMLRFVFRMFSLGKAVVPASGMGEIGRQLAARLPATAIRLASPVSRVTPGRVTLVGGETVACGQIVVATDGGTAARLLSGVPAPSWNGVSCVYFAADRSPIEAPVLVLNGDGVGPINNLCVPTQVAPEYGPGHRALVSASVIGEAANAPDLEDRVRMQLVEWFGEAARRWTHLRTYRIPQALPSQPPGRLEPPARPVRHGPGIYLAGDHLDTASTNGALASGRRAAEAILEDRRQRRAS